MSKEEILENVDEEVETIETDASSSEEGQVFESTIEVSEELDSEEAPRAKTGRKNGTVPEWYVVHTYSGHEQKVKANIEKLVENSGMQNLILSIAVPTEDVIEVKNGQRKVKTKKMFPGYVIVKMIMTDESWFLVRNTQGVTGFVGHGSKPIPLKKEEVKRMGIEKVTVALDVEVGDNVKVIDGPFASFMGSIEEINVDKEILRVLISMFGRETPVELEFSQVVKI